MRASAAAAPTRPAPALRPAAALVVACAGAERVAEPVALMRRLLGTDMERVGWTSVALPAGAPVLATMWDDVFVMTTTELLALVEVTGLTLATLDETAEAALLETALEVATG
jgi:hypothetical protein